MAMSSIIQSHPEESPEQQNSTRRRSLFPIKHLLGHLDIDVDDDDREAANLTNLTQNFLSVTKHFSNAEICELSDAALEQYAAEFLETRSTFGQSGNVTMGEKFWPTGLYEKKLTYATHPTMIKDNVKLNLVNQRDNKRATFAKRMKRRRNEAAGQDTSMPEGSDFSGGFTPMNAFRNGSTAKQEGDLPYSAAANIPIILEGSSPALASEIKRSLTPDGLPSPASFRSPSPSFVNEVPNRQNAPKRKRHDPAETVKSCDGENGTAGVAQGHSGSTDAQCGLYVARSLEEQALIDACHSVAWDAGVSAIQLQIRQVEAENQRKGAEAEIAGNDRKRLNCDHISETLQELLSRVNTEKKKKEEKMKAVPYSWFTSISTHRRASSA